MLKKKIAQHCMHAPAILEIPFSSDNHPRSGFWSAHNKKHLPNKYWQILAIRCVDAPEIVRM